MRRPDPSDRAELWAILIGPLLITVVVLGIERATWHPAQAVHGDPPAAVRFDVNTAPWPALMTVQGVGRSRAQAIVQERDRNGPFDSADSIADRVDGIGPETAMDVWDALRPVSYADPQS